MIPLLCSLLAVTLLALGFHLRKTRRLIGELENAVRSRRRLLLRESDGALKRMGLEALVRETNELIDRHNAHSAQNSGYSNQVEATLGAIQEAVLIFDGEHVVEYANESAERLFHQGRRVKGLRLESVLRSTSLLEFLDAYEENRIARMSQITVERKGEKLWFEASCSEVQGTASGGGASTLLVLHDVTRLKSLEMIRRDFVANVSHELRTPLTIIKGFAETLVEDNESLPLESRVRFLDKILNNAHRLHVLVEDLLTLSRLESKPDQVEPVVQSLRSLYTEIQDSYRSRLREGEQAIEVEFDDRIEEFAFDRFRINQVLDNLVENVFRYAPEFRELKLQARLNVETGFVDCAVSDDGPGIPGKDLPHIFERFYRVDKGRSRERGGTGLGLSITKHIVLLHGGEVRAESEPGKGTTILFSLPYRKTPAGPPEFDAVPAA